MTSAFEFKQWAATLSPQNNVAVDDGGLNIVELDPDGKPTGAHYEIGGIPEREVACSDCGDPVTTDDPYIATPCGTFCSDCMEKKHVRECAVCAAEFEL